MENLYSEILLITPSFFNYEKEIVIAIKNKGYNVRYYDERSITKVFDKALLKVVPALYKRRTQKYYNEIIQKNINIKFKYVIIIKCEMISEKTLKRMKKEFSNSIFILYMWDSVKNIKGILKKTKYFDKVLSFDRKDSQKNKFIIHRPLFYITDFQKLNQINTNDYIYDLCFIGTIHSDRYKILTELKKKYSKYNIKIYYYLYLQSKFIYYFYWVFKKEFRTTSVNDFRYSKLSSKEISEIVAKSRVIIDIQHPRQTGLTMRTIEMIGMGKKIVTTNSDIVHYDIYNEQNISIIKRRGINMSLDFIKSEPVLLNRNVYEKYSISAWVDDILRIER